MNKHITPQEIIVIVMVIFLTGLIGWASVRAQDQLYLGDLYWDHVPNSVEVPTFVTVE